MLSPHYAILTHCCTLHTAHYKLHTTHYTLNTLNCKLHTAHSSLHPAHCRVHYAHCTLHPTHFTMHTVHCLRHTAHLVQVPAKPGLFQNLEHHFCIGLDKLFCHTLLAWQRSIRTLVAWISFTQPFARGFIQENYPTLILKLSHQFQQSCS